MSSRLYSHTKAVKGDGTIQLNRKIFKSETIVYGAMLCLNYKCNEQKLRDRFPDLLKTIKGE